MAGPYPVRTTQRNLHHQLLRSGVLIFLDLTMGARAAPCWPSYCCGRNRRWTRHCGGIRAGAALEPLRTKAESQGSADFRRSTRAKLPRSRELPAGELTLKLAAEALERLGALARAS